MGRPPRNSQGGTIYHVIGRGLKPRPIFRSEEDYQEFDTVLSQAVERLEPRLLAYCVLPKHWHLILTPRKEGDLSKLMAWLTTTHSARWHAKPRRAGTGGLYERRFRSFPVQDNLQLLDVMRFVEAHPRRTRLVDSVGDWRWSSAFRRAKPDETSLPLLSSPLLSSPPVPLPMDWSEQLGVEMTAETLDRINHCIHRSCPYGDSAWVKKIATRLNQESTLRPRGRPRKVV